MLLPVYMYVCESWLYKKKVLMHTENTEAVLVQVVANAQLRFNSLCRNTCVKNIPKNGFKMNFLMICYQ